MKVILISAKARHGKDSLAEYLKDKLEQQGKRVAVDHFAKYIKGFLRDYYGWDGVTKDEFIRTKLQVLGTEKIKEDLNFKCFHAKRLAEDFQIVGEDFDYVLVPDTRFRDEVYYMKAMFPNDCISIRVTRLGFESELTQEQKSHKSECDLDEFNGFDYNIYTQNGLQHLHDECDRVLKKVLNY